MKLKQSPLRRFWIGPVLLLGLAFLLRVWGLDFGLPHRFHPDEVQYAEAALNWYIDGELRLHFVNPPLFIYTLIAAYFPWLLLSPVTYTETWVTQTFLFARLWSVFFGVLTVALGYTLGARVHSRKAGLVAMVLLAGLFLPARESHFAVNDSVATFLALLAIYLSLGLLRQAQPLNYALTGIATGLAAATKLTAGLVGVALLAAHLIIRPTFKLKEHLPLLLGLTAAIVTFLAVSIQLFLKPDDFTQDVVKHLEFGAEGYKGAQMAPASGWQFYIDVLGWGLGWALLLVIVLALIGVIRRRSRVGVVLVIFSVGLFIYLGAQQILFARFLLPAVPPLVVLAAVELVIWEQGWSFWQKHGQFVWPAVIGFLLLQPLAYVIQFNHLLTLADTREIATNWFLEQFRENTIVVTESYSIFPKSLVLDETWPYKIMMINERSDTNDDLDHYLARTTQFVVLSNYTYDRVRQDPADEALRQAQLAYLEENASLVKEFNPYTPGFDEWFYQDQIYGPARETLQRVRPGPLIKIYQPHRPQLDDLKISVPAGANFADQIHLLGYDLPISQVSVGQAVPITLYWQAPPDKSPEADFIQFNHLLDSSGALRGGYDRQPREYYRTSLWVPGEIVVDGYTVPVDADAPPGEYYLNVGYYITVGEGVVNLPLVIEGQMTDVTSVTIGPIEVVEP